MEAIKILKNVGQISTSTDDEACGNQIKNPEHLKKQLEIIAERIKEEGERQNQEERSREII